VGIGLLAAVIGLIALYNYRQYFIAWPHNRCTETTFSQHPH
jgi:hypothetical protein